MPFKRLGVVDLDDTGWYGEDFGKLRGAETPCLCDDLEAVVVAPNGDGLNEAVQPDALGELVQLAFLKRAAGVGGGLLDGVDGEGIGMRCGANA